MGYHAEDMIFQKWYDQFDWMHEHLDDGVFVLTLHPQVIGQSHRISRLEELYDYMRSKPGVEFAQMQTVADEWRAAQ
jgi:hypothetical protein